MRARFRLLKWRRQMRIELTWDGMRPTSVLKTVDVTRTPAASANLFSHSIYLGPDNAPGTQLCFSDFQHIGYAPDLQLFFDFIKIEAQPARSDVDATTGEFL